MRNKYRTLNADEFDSAIADSHTTILDARSAKDFAEEHIRNAINIDVSSPDFIYEANARLHRENQIAVYCKSGVRSKMAATLLSNQGFDIVYLNGGISEWKKAGKATER